MKYILFTLSIILSLQLKSQVDYSDSINVKSMESEEVEPYEIGIPTVGPNGKKYNSTSFGLTTIIATESNEKSPVISGKSLGFRANYLEKFRLCNLLSVGYTVEYNYNSYIFKQDSAKAFPDTVLHKKQSIRLSSFGASVFFRINFDARRGNYLGHYLDLGTYADWIPFRTSFQKDKFEYDEVTIGKIRNLNYVEKYQYGLYANIGLNKFNIYAKYRMSDILKVPYKSADLPCLTVGISYSFF